jgi:hypothetical protein
MPATTPSGWRAVHVDAGSGGLGTHPDQVRDADRELDDLDAALDVAFGVGEGLAVLERQRFGQLVDVLVDQVDEAHHHAGAALRVPGGPLLLRLGGADDGGVDVGRVGHRHLRLHLAGVRVHYVDGALGLPRRPLAVDEMGNLCGHERVPRQKC